MAVLSELHLKNFKSFKNAKLKIPMGFTAIVGPNGSGKSNIVDAICFVLGKSSAKTLRAGRFNELITYHNGKREKFSEVTLYFDNTERTLPIDSDKVGISRKVTLDGDSAYYLIWEEVEEKDGKITTKEKRKRIKKSELLDIIGKIGLKPDGPNIILQGDLLKIISMSPIERRKIIDEISGIAEFDEKKEKAKAELEKAREYIEKIDIRINEVKSNLEKLKKEKEDAEKYIAFNEELKMTKYALISKRIGFLSMVLDEIKNEIEKLNELKEEFQEDVDEIDNQITELKNKLNNIINELQEKGNEEVIELHKSIKELEISIENDRKTLDRTINELTTIEKGIEEKNNEVKETHNKIVNIRKEIMEKEKEIKEIQEKIGNLEREREDLKSKIKESEDIIEALKKKESEISEEIAKSQNGLYKLREELNKIEGEINKKSFALKNNNETIEKLKKELEILANKKEDTRTLYKELEDATVELEFSKKVLQKLEDEKKVYQNKLDELHSEYVKENARIKALKEMEEMNLDRTIKEILNANLPGVVDIVGNLGKTKPEYQTAIEIAAGNRLNFIVVKRMEDGARAIEYLKRRNLGRATFLPLDRIEGREADYLYDDGVVGRAIDLVVFDEKYRNVFNYVFGNTIIVENLDVAKKLSKKYKRIRFVTLEGDVIEPSGAMVGGSVRRKSRIKVDVDLSKLKQLADEIMKVEDKLKEIKRNIEELNSKISYYSSRKAELESRLKIIMEDESKKEETIKNNNLKIKELELENKILSESLEELNESKEELLYKIGDLEKKINNLINQRENILNELKSFENQQHIARIKEIDSEIEKLTKIKNKMQNEIEKGLTLVKDVLIPKINELNERIKELNEKKEILSKNIEFYKSNMEKNTEILKKKREKYEELTKNLKELNEKKERYENEIKNLYKQKNELLNKIKEIENKIGDLLVDKAKYEAKLEEEERKLYLCEKVEVSEKLMMMDIDELERHQANLETEIKKLEPVNMRAIEDYNFVFERYNELIEKRKEYERDEKKYLQLMEEVEKRKKEVFMEVFEKVAENFEKIYKEIGGTGKLSLENEENPFEGGLLIDASPKGKKLQSLDVMSGGEKSLTALAFLFAIQELNPSPFYVLDEVDAALDTKNAALIGDMIKNASKTTQFIVISHREQMVSRADTLYGVCMENGLSKIVGIKL
ncbi:chromosome segregation protein SMC [Methanotorris formicicus]|uniref:Chromosome partition protein Smc n=1 Tax=Methanotorris formicicus Mc-S-70 TaxID=647171 RepID=H1KWK2_9EURY|nr:chromosome segregation protein SMC [Methanotorris formicicus]EHP89579.1 chromosome segregation protein SMC [Methanotorris formicicus Mc-S-70]